MSPIAGSVTLQNDGWYEEASPEQCNRAPAHSAASADPLDIDAANLVAAIETAPQCGPY